MGAVHHAVAVAVAVDADGPLAGVLILGPPGSGKSSLALALIDHCPFRRTALVADDAVEFDRSDGGAPVAHAPAPIRGLIEVRGFGPAPVRTVGAAVIVAAFDLAGDRSRTPAPGQWRPDAFAIAAPLYPFAWETAQAAAPARLRTIIASILGGQMPEPTQDSG